MMATDKLLLHILTISQTEHLKLAERIKGDVILGIFASVNCIQYIPTSIDQQLQISDNKANTIPMTLYAVLGVNRLCIDVTIMI